MQGSSSVTPVMEKLKEAYLAVNKEAEIEVQESDSTTGMTAAMEGTCDIGMASRELKRQRERVKSNSNRNGRNRSHRKQKQHIR